MAEDAPKAVIPLSESMPIEEAFSQYDKLHTPEAMQKRNKEQKDIRDSLVDIVKYDLGDAPSLDANNKDAAYRILTELGRIYQEKVFKEKGEVSEEHIRDFVSKATGGRHSYETLAMTILNAPDLTTYEALPDDLKQVIEYVTQMAHEETRYVTKLGEILQKPEHKDSLVKLVQDATGVKFDASATPQNILQQYGDTAGERYRIALTNKQKTYTAGPAPPTPQPGK